MSIARAQFVGRTEAIRTILSDPIAVDKVPVPVASSAAVVTRNGCMVMLFCALEGFIRDRSLECAKIIDQTTVPYAHLPSGLKYASLIATFEGLINSTRGWTEQDKILEFEQAAVAAAAGKLGSTYQFSKYSFARDKSNISVDDVGTIAKSFGVPKYWTSAKNVATKAGITIPGNVEDLFRQLARQRHKAAHSATENIPHSRIAEAIPQATSVALTFDTLVSTATYLLSSSGIATGVPLRIVSDSDVNFLTVRPHAGKWAAFQHGRAKALFVEADQKTALAKANAIAKTKQACVVCHNSAGNTSSWSTVLG